MKNIMLVILVLLLPMGSLQCSKSGSGSGTASTTYQVTMQPVRTTWPIVKDAAGQWEIVGEIRFMNTGTEHLTLQSVNLRVLDSGSSVLADRTYASQKFRDMIVIVLKDPAGYYTETSLSASALAPSDLGFSHVAALADSASLPALARVTVSFSNGRSESTDIPLYEFLPIEQTIWPLTFANGNWLAFDTGETTYHWSAITWNPAISDFVIDQRYAIDAVQVDPQLSLSNPSPAVNKEDYYAWGENILSAGSGTVVTVVNDQIDQELSKVWTSADTNAMGNYVVIRHGAARFSLYVHMMKSSATVTVGDHVAAGQVIGKIGNSGLTGNPGFADGMPHLHFQFMDAKDRIKAQGLPALFWNIKIERRTNAELLNAFGRVPDIRTVYDQQAGTYSVSGGTPLEGEIITAP